MMIVFSLHKIILSITTFSEMIFHGEQLENHDKPVHEVLLERFKVHQEKDPDNVAFVTAENEDDSLGFQQLGKKVLQISEWFVENGYKKVRGFTEKYLMFWHLKKYISLKISYQF